MTGSRGGIFISLLCCFIFFILTVLRGNLHSQTRKFIIICSAIFMGSILTWIFLNFGQMFVSILEREGFSHHTRLEIYSAVIPMIRDHAWLGVGLDNFAGVFQQYRPKDVSADGIIDKAHNSYLEFAAELGLPGLLILLCSVVAIGMILVNGVVGRKERYVTPALGLSIWLLAALHSLIDFPLQIPGIAAIVIAVVTICASQADPRFSEPATSSSKTAPVRRIRIRKQRSFSKSG